jgi:hypothetical protein
MTRQFAGAHVAAAVTLTATPAQSPSANKGGVSPIS